MADVIHPVPTAGSPRISDAVIAGRVVLSCLPMLVIVGVLVAAGGTQAGFMIPAVVAGAVIGMLMFGSLNDRPLH